jgi:hypothetical protein
VFVDRCACLGALQPQKSATTKHHEFASCGRSHRRNCLVRIFHIELRTVRFTSLKYPFPSLIASTGFYRKPLYTFAKSEYGTESAIKSGSALESEDIPMWACSSAGRALRAGKQIYQILHLLDLAGADAIRLKVASRDKTLQAVFLLFVFLHFAIYRDLPRVVRKDSIRAVFQRGVTLLDSDLPGVAAPISYS